MNSGLHKIFILAGLALVGLGCGQSSSESYSNLIKFGKSLDANTGELLEVTDTFTLGSASKLTIAFYLESAEDFSGNGVVLDLRTCGEGGAAGGMWSYNFNSENNVGHELAGTFPVTYASQFCATAKISSTPSKKIADGSFTVN